MLIIILEGQRFSDFVDDKTMVTDSNKDLIRLFEQFDFRYFIVTQQVLPHT